MDIKVNCVTKRRNPVSQSPSKKRNRVSVVNTKVDGGTEKRNPVSGVSQFREGDRFFTPKKRNRVSVVNIKVNCGSKRRNPVSESPAFFLGERSPNSSL